MMIDNFWVFALTGLMLNLTPGNDMLYIIARSTRQGMKAGIISAIGTMVGCFIHIIFAVVGISAIIAKSALAFTAIKFIGAGYLIYLGIKTIFSKSNKLPTNENLQTISMRKVFWQGVLTNALNPKVALFFLAFIPQFVDVSKGNVSWQFLFLGTWFDLVGTIVNIIIAILFGKIGAMLSKSPRFIIWQQRITGSLLIAVGIKVAMSKRN